MKRIRETASCGTFYLMQLAETPFGQVHIDEINAVLEQERDHELDLKEYNKRINSYKQTEESLAKLMTEQTPCDIDYTAFKQGI